MKKEAKRNSILMIVLLLCTITIIWTNYVFTQKTITDINELLLEKEYEKIWWEENYLILQEIQKREILWYIDSLKKEKPELIEEILEFNKEETKKQFEVLNKETIYDLKENNKVYWEKNAKISIIKFSNEICEYCKEQDKKEIPKQLMDKYNLQINYIYKTVEWKDLEQAKELWITHIPTSIIIKNETGEFSILSEVREIEDFEEVINKMIK